MISAKIIQQYEEKIFLLEKQNLFLEENLISLKANNKLYQQRYEQYQQAYEQLQHLLNEFRRHRFGKKSERFIDDENNPQINFFAPQNISEIQNELEEITIAEHKRRNIKKKDKEKPTRIEIIPVSEEE